MAIIKRQTTQIGIIWATICIMVGLLWVSAIPLNLTAYIVLITGSIALITMGTIFTYKLRKED